MTRKRWAAEATLFSAYTLAIAWLFFSALFAAPRPPAYSIIDYAPSRNYSARPYGLVSYSGRTKTPDWVLERLTEKSLEVNVKRDNHGFHSDEKIPKPFRVSPAQYDLSGQDRGHLACAANHRSNQDEFDSTFAMSNMMPQYHAVNAGCWKDLEDAIRKLAVGDAVVWVLTAPAYLPADNGRITVQTIGTLNVWRPTHCVKCVLIERPGAVRECKAWVVPNVPNPNGSYDDYLSSTDYAEEVIGYDVWACLPEEEQKRLESRK